MEIRTKTTPLTKAVNFVKSLASSFQARADRARAEQEAFVAALEKQVEKHGLVAVTRARNPFLL